MEALIRPDIGLSFWTIVCFVVLILVLKKTAWGPLINAINNREEGLRRNIEGADNARKEAEKIKDELNTRLADLKSEVKEQLEKARAEAAREKESIMAEARKSAEAITQAAKKEIEAQQKEALREMRKRVSEISLLAAGQVLRKTLDQNSNAELAGKCLEEIEQNRPDLKMDARQN